MTTAFYASTYKIQLRSSADIVSCPKVPLPHIDEHENYIFISYAHSDYRMVYADLADMFEAGVRFWYDKGLSAGKLWDKEVMSIITDSRCVGVLFYMSENLFASPSANLEMEITLNLSKEDPSGYRSPINHFSINLTDKSPTAILTACLQQGTLNMNRISILSQIFKDNATYIHYHAAEHKSELITQIQTQFGVMNTSDAFPFQLDYVPTAVYIGTLFEKIATDERLRLVSELQDILQVTGISSYVQQDCGDSNFCNGVNQSLREYTQQQNQQKLDAASHVLIISTMLGWSLCAKYFNEFETFTPTSKNIFYLIDGPSASAECFNNFYHLNADHRVLDRVFFTSDYKKRLPNAILSMPK